MSNNWQGDAMNFESIPNRRWARAALLSTLLLVASACGSAGRNDDSGVASLTESVDIGASVENGDTSSVDAGLEAPENPEDAFALFNECMTKAGFDFGSAVSVGVGSSGSIDVEPGEAIVPDGVDPQQNSGSLEDFDPEAFDRANETCEGHLANIDSGFDLTPEQQAAIDDAQLEWSACMSDQGVEVPELQSSNGGSGAIVIDGSAEAADPQSGEASFEDFDFDFEAFDEAAQICQSVYDQYDELDGLFDENPADR